MSVMTFQTVPNVVWPGSQAARSYGSNPLDLIGSPAKFPRDTEIYCEDEPAESIYRVLSGAVRLSKVLSDGRRQISAFCLPSDLFGLECDCIHTFSAEAIDDSLIQILPKSEVSRLANYDAGATTALWQATMRDLARAQAHMLLLGRKTALERVAAFLLDMAGRAGTEDLVRLPMSRYDIADYLGLTIETVSRTLSQLEDQGLIRLDSARKILIKNRPGLERLND